MEGALYTEAGNRKYLTLVERERFVAAAAKQDLATFGFCLVLCLTGCRVSEALALKPCHIDLEEGVLRFRTLKRRGGAIVFRAVPVPNELLLLLSGLSCDPQEAVFPFHRSTAWRRLRAIMGEARIAGPQATGRGLRHTFGVQADAALIPQPVLQRWMGHTKLESTAIYRQAVGAEEKALAERLCWLNGQKPDWL